MNAGKSKREIISGAHDIASEVKEVNLYYY